MILQNYYYYFKSALSERFCDEVIKYGNQQQEQIALTGTQKPKNNKNKKLNKKELNDLKQKRNSNIVWLDFCISISKYNETTLNPPLTYKGTLNPAIAHLIYRPCSTKY